MFVIAIFKDRNETIKFNANLKRFGVNSMIFSTPKGLGSSCSVCVKFYFNQLSQAIYVLKVGGYLTFNYFIKIVNNKNNVAYEIINI